MPSSANLPSSVAEAVDALEAGTDAEVVVVIVGRSGSYDDVAAAAGVAVTAATLAFLCWSPWLFDARHFPIDLALVYAVVFLVVRGLPAVTRAFAGRRRLVEQVRAAARAAFVDENVHGTVDRLGLLVYWSRTERRVELVPDQGLLGRVPPDAWPALDVGTDDPEAFLAALPRLGAVLATYAPATGQNPNLLPNAPRVRP